MAERWTDVRVGDRFEYGHRRITITGVRGDEITYSQLNEDDKSIWSMTTVLPLPSYLVRVGRGPKRMKVRICARCFQEPTEPGQVYCWNCTVEVAQEWVGLSAVDAQKVSEALATKVTEKERDEDDDDDEAEAEGG